MNARLSDRSDVVVVGGSVAGVRTAAALRRHGYGGRIRVVSAEAAGYYYRPGLSKGFLSGDQDEPALELPVDAAWGAEILAGARATALDSARRRLTVVHDERAFQLEYDGLVVATGLTPRRLALPATLPEGVHHVRELHDARRLRAELATAPRVVVVGGGLIGSEVASTSRRLGLDVTVVDVSDGLLHPVIGRRVGDRVTRLHRDHGVRVLTGAAVTAIEGHPRVESVALSTGARLAADVVVVAVGARPQTDWLEGSGLRLDDGVLCEANLAALGADGIVAVGDLARPVAPNGASRRFEHWENALRQADIAARTLLEGSLAPADMPPTTFWSNQYDLRLHVTGHPAPTDELRLLEGALDDLDCIAAYHRAGEVTALLSLNRPQRLRAYRHLLGHESTHRELSA